jgi:hypothetical protein
LDIAGPFDNSFKSGTHIPLPTEPQVRNRIALKSPGSRLLANPACWDPKALGKLFCREQFELFPGTFAPQPFSLHFQPSKINHFRRWAAAWHTADL